VHRPDKLWRVTFMFGSARLRRLMWRNRVLMKTVSSDTPPDRADCSDSGHWRRGRGHLMSTNELVRNGGLVAAWGN
jgi:hypothetical protein